MRSPLRALSALAFALALAGAACSKCGEQAGEDAGARALEPPVPAPASLLADVYVTSPNSSWSKIQRGVGGAVGILPASAGGIVCAMVGLEPAVANEVDGTAPLFGVVAGDPAAPGFALAMKLSDLRKARALLVDGDTARYSPREVAGLTELVPKGEEAPSKDAPRLAIGVTKGSYLVVASNADELAKLGPYVTRTLPTRPLPEGGAIVVDVPRASIASVLKPKVEELWEGAKAYLLAEDARVRRDRGRAPDFGDPAAIVAAVDAYAVERIAVLADLEKMRIDIDVVDDGVVIDARMVPLASGGPARVWTDAMTTGDTAPIVSLPATSAVAALLRDGEAQRVEGLRGFEKGIASSLGARLAEADGKKLHDVVEGWIKAGPSTLSASLFWDEPRGLFLRAAVRDADAAAIAMKGALDLLRASPFKDGLQLKEIATANEDVSGVGKVSVATLLREPKRDDDKGGRRRVADDAGAPATKKESAAIAWLADGAKAFSIGAGEEPLPILRGGIKPDKKIGDEPALVRPLKALGSNASSVLVIQPLRFDPRRAELPAAPVVVALGRRDKDAFLRIDVANGVLRELARWQMGL
ncbi:MAG: hypothetical protein KF819_22075 [Labilithrix sp.]|nr:hypothetical protein [Labilithrix sp.]